MGGLITLSATVFAVMSRHSLSPSLVGLSISYALQVVWCGVVWCGVVWCGVVWCGVVWCGVVWCGVVWCGVAWCGAVFSVM